MSAIKTKHVPALRFPEFTEPWKTDSVDSFVKRVNNPVVVEPDTIYREIGVRSHGKGIFHKEPVTGKSLGNKRVFWVHPKAFVVNIVFGWEQAVALTSDAEEGFIASHRFPMFVPVGKNTDLSFLLLFFLRKRGKYLLELASPGGAGRNKTLGQNEFAKLDVTLPTLPEQQKIANVIAVVDKKVEALRRQRDLLQTYKRGMMQKIFSRELRFRADDGAEYPAWTEKRLGKIAEIVSGGTPETGKKEYWDGGIQWFTPSEIKDKYLKTSKRTISELGIKKSSAKLLPVGSLLLSTRATVGDVGIGTLPCTTNQGFQSLVVNKGNINEFWYYWILMNKKEFLKRAAGSTFLEINKASIQSIRALVPHPDEQQKIADFLSAIDAKIVAVAGQIEKIEQFKKGLLQQMFV